MCIECEPNGFIVIQVSCGVTQNHIKPCPKCNDLASYSKAVKTKYGSDKNGKVIQGPWPIRVAQ